MNVPRWKQVALIGSFLVSLLALARFLGGDFDPMPLGSPYPSFVAAAIALVLAALLAPLIVDWLGGEEAVSEMMKRDAARRAMRSPVFGAAMEETARTGMSLRDQRIVMGALAFFPILVVLLALAEIVNGASTSSAVSLTCQIDAQRRRPRSGRVEVSFSCLVRGSEWQRASGMFDAELPPLTRTAEARRGALGVWLLPKSAVIQR